MSLAFAYICAEIMLSMNFRFRVFTAMLLTTIQTSFRYFNSFWVQITADKFSL